MSANQIPPLTRKTAEKLNQCIEKLASLVEDGWNPTEALVKVANEHNLLPQQIIMVGHAYNTGLANHRLLEQRDLTALHSEILANPHAVVEQLYPSESKTKKASHNEEISGWYLYSIPEHIKTARGVQSNHWAFGDNIWEKEVSKESKEREFMRLYRELRTKQASLKTMVLNLADRIQQAVTDIQYYFKTASAIDPQEVLENCSIWNPPLAKILEMILSDEEFKKQASGRAYLKRIPVDWEKPPYSLLQGLYDDVQRYAEFREVYEDHRSKLAAIETKLGLEPDFGVEPEKPQEDNEPYLTRFFQNGGYATNFFRKTAGQAKDRDPLAIELRDPKQTIVDIAQQFRQLDPSRVTDISRTLAGWRAPSETELTVSKLISSTPVLAANAATVKVLLTDLMLNDPVISNYPPEKVYGAFAKLLQIAPLSASRSEILRTAMRKMLTMEQLEPQDIQNLISLDKQLMEQAASMNAMAGGGP